MTTIRVCILTASDSCSSGSAEDRSGPALQDEVTRVITDSVIADYAVVPDDLLEIKNKLLQWCDECKVDLILTTGGTGFGPRDITPEATKKVITREAPALAQRMIIETSKITPMAALSRLTAGIRDRTIIVNLPGSKKGSLECFSAIRDLLPHALHVLHERQEDVRSTHEKLESKGVKSTAEEHHRHHHNRRKSHSADNLELSPSKVSATEVVNRARESKYPLIGVKEARKIIIQNTPTSDIFILNYIECLNHVLAESISSKVFLPPFHASMKDGYAVVSSDGVGRRKVVEVVVAGNEPHCVAITSGTCARINTGAPVPKGADAVVQVEDTKLISTKSDGQEENEVDIRVSPKVGQDIRSRGSDVTQGETVLQGGTILGPTEIGILASIGEVKVPIFKRPRVAVISTGNEIRDPENIDGEGQIFDSNRPSILTLLLEAGYRGVDGGIVRDEPNEIKWRLEKCMAVSDVIITSGGVSMGEKDYLKDVLIHDFNATIHFGRVFMKPGKPTTFATCKYNKKPKMIFSLPGNPVSCVVTYHLFVLPALKKYSGNEDCFGTTIPVQVSQSIKLDSRPEYQRAIVSYLPGANLPMAEITGNQRSSRLTSLKCANALLILPPRTEDKTELIKDSVVDALLISSL